MSMTARGTIPLAGAALLGAAAILAGAGTRAQQARDVAVAASGTARLTGVVASAGDQEVPVRRAVVTLGGPAAIAGRSAITDDRGRFSFANLPAGRFTVEASKAAYLDAAFGATRPGRPGTTVALADGQSRELRIEMARGSVLEGLIRDDAATPLADVTVYALDVRRPGPIGRLVDRSRRTFSTDDRGIYRIFGLPPGEYVIAAALPVPGDGVVVARADDEMDAVLARLQQRRSGTAPAVPGAARDNAPAASSVGFPLTYYPGVPMFGGATRIRIGAGEERLGLDFTLARVPAAVLSGTVTRGDGQPLDSVELSMIIDGPRNFQVGTLPVLRQPVGPDGRFAYAGVVPGRYRIYARDGGRGRAGDLVAVAEVDVFGQDVTGIPLVLRPGATFAGRIIFDASAPPAPEPADIIATNVRLQPQDGGWASVAGGTQFGTFLMIAGSPVMDYEGRFRLRGVGPGRYTLSSQLPPQLRDRFWLRSATWRGRDLLDGPLDVGADDIADVVLTFSDRRNELAGSLESAAGLPATEYFVVVFPEDRTLWAAGERRIRATRPATDGRFSVADLPAGRYLIGALTDFETADLEDPSFLEQLAAQAVPVVVRDGERTVQGLRIAR